MIKTVLHIDCDFCPTGYHYARAPQLPTGWENITHNMELSGWKIDRENGNAICPECRIKHERGELFVKRTLP